MTRQRALLTAAIVTGLFSIASALVGAAATYELTRPTSSPAQALLFRDERVPSDGTSIILDMPASSVFYFSGSQFEYQNRYCSDAQDLCVFLDTISSPRTVQIDGVIPMNNFVEGRIGWSELDVLADKQKSFWDGSNCGGVCGHVDVYFFRDGQLQERWRLTSPPSG